MTTGSLRWGMHSRSAPLNGGRIVVIALVAVLTYQVLVPLLLIVWTSLKTICSGEPRVLELRCTLANYARAYGISEFWEASLNTLYFASLSTLFDFLAATYVAW